MKEDNPHQRQSCYDCASLYTGISLWCMNKEAHEYRRTNIPGVYHCHFWTPDWDKIEDEYKPKSELTMKNKLKKYLWELAKILKKGNAIAMKPTMRCNIKCPYCAANMTHG